MSCSLFNPSSPSPLKLSPKTNNYKKIKKPPTFLCCSSSSSSSSNLPRLILHDTLDAAGIDTKHARAAREGFCQQIGRLGSISAASSIAVSKGADLARTALHVAAEDDSLVSHSSVPLPVDDFIERLDSLSMGFCSLYMPPLRSPPEVFIASLERYLYVHKGFHRTNSMSDARALYLHSVLTCRTGSPVMLSLIYSEMLKMLRIYSFLDFDVEIYFPHDVASLPRGYHKQKSKSTDHGHIMTSKSLLVEILKNLKEAFWPFQYDHSSSLFLRAAHAANHIHGPNAVGGKYSESFSSASGLDIASAKAAQHRLGRGVWTNVCFGDMRRALAACLDSCKSSWPAACERLFILTTDYKELRDYAVLLYHCGYYEECLHNLKLYQSSRQECDIRKRTWSSRTVQLEEDAVERLMARVKLILEEEGWSECKTRESFWANNQEPW